MPVFRFNDSFFDSEEHTLFRRGMSHRLSTRNSKLLCYLIDHRDRVISRDEIVEAVWVDVVSDWVVNRAIGDIRLKLGDDARQPTYILTVPKQGYQWIFAETITATREAMVLSNEPSAVEAPQEINPKRPIWFLLTAFVALSTLTAFFIGSPKSPPSLNIPNAAPTMLIFPFARVSSEKQIQMEISLRTELQTLDALEVLPFEATKRLIQPGLERDELLALANRRLRPTYILHGRTEQGKTRLLLLPTGATLDLSGTGDLEATVIWLTEVLGLETGWSDRPLGLEPAVTRSLTALRNDRYHEAVVTLLQSDPTGMNRLFSMEALARLNACEPDALAELQPQIPLNWVEMKAKINEAQANQHMQRGEFQAALRQQTEARTHYRHIRFARAYFWATLTQAKMELESGDKDAARRLVEELVPPSESARRVHLLFQSLVNIDKTRKKKQLTQLEQGSMDTKRDPFLQREGLLVNARVAELGHDLGTALTQYNRLLQLSDKFHAIPILQRMAMLRAQMGQLDEAKRLLQLALEQTRALGNSVGERHIMNGLALISLLADEHGQTVLYLTAATTGTPSRLEILTRIYLNLKTQNPATARKLISMLEPAADSLRAKAVLLWLEEDKAGAARLLNEAKKRAGPLWTNRDEQLRFAMYKGGNDPLPPQAWEPRFHIMPWISGFPF